MTQQNLTNLTLVLGFIDGLRATRRMTAAQAAAYMDGLTPEHAEAYLHGHNDAIVGDRARFTAANAALARADVTVSA